jgi:hypothetical protein
MHVHPNRANVDPVDAAMRWPHKETAKARAQKNQRLAKPQRGHSKGPTQKPGEKKVKTATPTKKPMQNAPPGNRPMGRFALSELNPAKN